MDFLRRLARMAGLGLWLLLLAPALALVPAAILDLGPGGAVRLTLFPLALAVLDPFLRACARNSVLASSMVAAGSLVVGVGLSRVITGWRFWGRRPLAALALAPMAVSPLFGAIGLRLLFGPRLVAGAAGTRLGWLAWIWVEMASGAPLVALASASALARVEPAWVDAARLAGASRLRTWWQLIWPVVRPDAARAAAVVFTLTLVEPGAPLVLGLRRTLAFQVVEAALGADPLPRAAVLAVEGIGLGLIGWMVLRALGGRPCVLPTEVTGARGEVAEWPRATAFVLLLGAGAVIAWLPAWSLILSGLSSSDAGSPAGWHLSASAFLERLGHAETRALAANSLALGLAVVAIDLALARTLAGRTARRSSLKRVPAWPEVVPPLAVGVGAMAIAWLLHLAVDSLHAAGRAEVLVRGFGSLADALDLNWTPGVLLVLAVAAVRHAPVVRVAELVRHRSRDVLVEAAINLGATPRKARRTASSARFGVPAGVLLVTLAMAATNLTPALILARTIESRAVAPGILILSAEPGDAPSRAAALATCAILVNLSALAVAARSRTDPLGEWFRGGP